MTPSNRARLAIFAALAVIGSLEAVDGQKPAPAQSAPATRFTRAAAIDAPIVRASAGLDKLLPRQAETIYQAVASRFRPARAMDTVTFMDRFWRLPVNAGFSASLDHIKTGLVEAGFKEGALSGTLSPVLAVEEYPNGGNGWELVRAEMTIVQSAAGTAPERVFDPVTDYIALCMNSFS
ncbi:MAG: hypothetical protein EHM24_06000, partial [Acidobacteria bacterium]